MLNQLDFSTPSEGAKTVLKLSALFAGMVCLGSALALYSESQWLVIPFLGALTITSFAALDYALYILVAFLPFSFRFKMLSGTEMQIPTEPLLAVMAVALFLRLIVSGRRGINIKFPFRLPFMMYAVSLLLSMINAGYLYAAAKGSMRAIAYMILAVVTFYVITDRRRLKWLFIAGIAPAIVAVGWTFIFLADRLDMWMWSSAYEGLPFTSYAHYGSFVAVILLILLARFIYDRGSYDRVIWTALLGFFFVGLCFCFSRGVWISFIAAVGLMVFHRSSGIQHKRILIVGGGIALFAILLCLPYISGLIMARARTIMSFGFGSNRARILRWGTALLMFRRSPITGCGYGSFGYVFVNNPKLIGEYVSQFGLGAHSEYLQTLAETGLIGFFAWMWILVSFYMYGFRLLRKLEPENGADSNGYSVHLWRSLVIGIMAAETSLFIHFLVNNLIQADIIGVPFWLLIGLLPAIGNIAEKEKRSSAG